MPSPFFFGIWHLVLGCAQTDDMKQTVVFEVDPAFSTQPVHYAKATYIDN
jgi:hypothetical protein